MCYVVCLLFALILLLIIAMSPWDGYYFTILEVKLLKILKIRQLTKDSNIARNWQSKTEENFA